ncbi:MAG: hypothetical protein OER88_03310 [Planctomycetota bacterium]|nr:hypothetical protein [Planctomycetota bacterium]
METSFETTVTLKSAVRVERGVPGGPLVIALHGWGMNERSFSRWLRPGVEDDRAARLSWWVARGTLPCELQRRPRKIGYGWYVFNGDQDALRASMDEARAYLVGLARTAQRALRPSSISLLGFSQGAYLGSYVALSHPDLFARLVCCCGRPKTEFVTDLDAAGDVRVLIQTGARDDAMTPELIAKGVDPLQRAGLDVTVASYDAPHKLIPAMAADAARFLSS